MLPEEQVRRLAPKDVLDLSLSDMLGYLCGDGEKAARELRLSFGGLIKEEIGARFDKHVIVFVTADGSTAAKASNRELLSATVMESTPESIVFAIDETKRQIELSIHEAACAIVLY